MTFRLRLLVFFVSSLVLSSASFARSSSSTTTKSKASGHVTENARAQKRMARLRHKRAARRHVAARSATARSTSAKATGSKSFCQWRDPKDCQPASPPRLATAGLSSSPPAHFPTTITDGDIVEGEDPVVRQAAIDALGNMNGTVVAIDPTSGRILAMVNQKLALSEGAQPCSTIKVAVALAGLSEKVITREESIALGGRSHMTSYAGAGAFQQRLF